MQATDKLAGRLTLIAFVFAFINCLFEGFSGGSLLLLVVLTVSVYCSSKLYGSMLRLAEQAPLETASLRFFLTILGLIFIAIATLTYSVMFGVFFGLIAALFIISPQDRDWLAGRSRIVMTDNKLEYRQI